MYLADESTFIGGFATHVLGPGETPRNSLRAAKTETDGRVAELERENERLQHLVAELLLTNQKLRGSV